MEICNASGVGICSNCNRVPPKINGYSTGDICRITAQNIINEIVDKCKTVIYDKATGEFYSTEIFFDGNKFRMTDDEWEQIE